MHLLVLSAFRPNDSNQPKGDDVSQCTFWCSVLSDQVQTAASNASALGLNAPSGAQCFPTATADWSLLIDYKSQCTFWCSVLSDMPTVALQGPQYYSVSMHLLVLSAFRHLKGLAKTIDSESLNAPSGAQCFPTEKYVPYGGAGESQCTFWCPVLSDGSLASIPKQAPASLNAPSGAQCFPTLE